MMRRYVHTQGEQHHRLTRLVVAVSPEVFEDVRRRARMENISTAEKVRQLIEWGALAEDEHDARERETANG